MRVFLKVARTRCPRSFAPAVSCFRLAAFATLILAAASAAAGTARPPETRTDNVVDTLHGVEVKDPYRWLEDQESAETRAWIEAQNDYTASLLGSLPGREQITRELTALVRVDSYRIPQAGGERYFFHKTLAEQNLSSIYMREGLQGADHLLIDPHGMSEDQSISVRLMEVSQDGNMMAYGVRYGGEDEVTVRFYDVEGRSDLPDELPTGRYDEICFEPGNGGVYYSLYLDEGPRVYYHRMGGGSGNDREIEIGDYGPGKGVSIALSEDGRYLLYTVWHGSAALKSEVYFIDLEDEGRSWTVVNDIDARFEPAWGGDYIYIRTNWNAPNGRILRLRPDDVAAGRSSSPAAWEEILPETEGVIEGFTPAGGRIFVNYLENVVSSVQIFYADGRCAGTIDFPSLGSASGVRGRWKESGAFFSFSSYHIPPTIYHYDTTRGIQIIWARRDVPIDSERYQTKQVWVTSADGTRVPMFVVHAVDLDLDGNRPTLLSGYGGFNHAMTPWFGSYTAMWIKHGGVYAVPGLRGGGEFGESWHRAGMLESKQNTFDDFIAAAEWLIDNGYTNPRKMAISGGSNGGLLVGAALTQRPDLFKAVVCTYPLLDMVRYDKFLVAAFWVSEYGSAEDAEQFKYIYAYSPYHNVMRGREYPAVLFVTGDADTRVDPLHARKMTALLQAANASRNPILLQYDTRAGHSGGKPTDKYINDLTDEMLFLFWQLDIPPD